MSILGRLADLFGPVTEAIDALHTSDAERLEAKAKLALIQAEVINAVVEYEQNLATAKAQIITAEAQSDSWLTRSWRPLVMLTFTTLIVLGQFGGPPVPEPMWPLLQFGLGGSVVGRSGEKIARGVTEALKKEEEA